MGARDPCTALRYRAGRGHRDGTPTLDRTKQKATPAEAANVVARVPRLARCDGRTVRPRW